MSDDSTNLRRLLLVAPGDGAGRTPLGEREKVAALLKELLPRLTFDAEWTGIFARSGRQLRRFTFEGSSPVRDGEMTVYPDYAYIATPVGDGPANRRSFAVSPDGLIRFRKDGTPPQKSDTILGTER